MNIVIVTTPNESMNETGFGNMNACLSLKKSLSSDQMTVDICSCRTENELESIVKQSPDIAILAVKYIHLSSGKKIWLSDYFESASINYTGSIREVLEFDSNKIKAKELIGRKGVITANFITLTPYNYLVDKAITLNYPLFLKPLDAANGNGIDDDSIVHNHEALIRKTSDLFNIYGNTVIAETFLSGREFTVSVIYSTEQDHYIVSPIEIIPPSNKDNIRFLGAQVKKNNSEELICVSDVLIRDNLIAIAIKAFKVLRVRDFGRIDIRMDTHNVCHFIEANLVPGMTEGSSYFPKAFEMDKHLNYSEVINLMIENAVNRVN